jgi:hypothetical protein
MYLFSEDPNEKRFYFDRLFLKDFRLFINLFFKQFSDFQAKSKKPFLN